MKLRVERSPAFQIAKEVAEETVEVLYLNKRGGQIVYTEDVNEAIFNLICVTAVLPQSEQEEIAEFAGFLRKQTENPN